MNNEVRLIDANALEKKAAWMEIMDHQGIPSDVKAVSASTIELAPTIDPESLIPTGKWLDKKWDSMWEVMTATCSHCLDRGEVRYKMDEYGLKVINSPRCPNCGAKMENG